MQGHRWSRTPAKPSLSPPETSSGSFPLSPWHLFALGGTILLQLCLTEGVFVRSLWALVSGLLCFRLKPHIVHSVLLSLSLLAIVDACNVKSVRNK